MQNDARTSQFEQGGADRKNAKSPIFVNLPSPQKEPASKQCAPVGPRVMKRNYLLKPVVYSSGATRVPDGKRKIRPEIFHLPTIVDRRLKRWAGAVFDLQQTVIVEELDTGRETVGFDRDSCNGQATNAQPMIE